jgi:phenylacetate-coenzyme A ligase PaaK-like adenylate-forming protein
LAVAAIASVAVASNVAVFWLHSATFNQKSALGINRLFEMSARSRNLADLFNLAMSAGDLRGPLILVLQSFLLRRTLLHAKTYARYYGSRSIYRDAIESALESPLHACPTINRQTVAENFSEFLASDVVPRSVCHTSGTTGQPLEVYKSYEEVDFVYKFYSRLFSPVLAAMASRPLTVSFPTPHHGVPVPMPSPGFAFISGVMDDTLIQDAVRVLKQKYEIPGHDSRISILSGMAFQVLFFTSYLLEQKIDPSDFRLNAVNIAGGFVPTHWRRFLKRNWNAQINDRFSLTESLAGASRCQECEWFKPDPHLIAETVDVDTGQPVQQGIGRLVITDLYPFVQMQPLIRYETGDLVESRVCSCWPLPVLRFLGREKNAISSKRGGERRRWLIFSSELYEFLATLPDLRVYDWFSNVRVARDRTVGSLPLVSVKSTLSQDGKIKITLSAELKYAPHCYPERVADLRNQILHHLAVC